MADIYEQMDGQATRGFVPLVPVVSTPGKWSEEPDAGLPGHPLSHPAPVLERRLREGGALPKATRHARAPQGPRV